MTPRPGGEADKIGNRYEDAWTTSQLLQVLAGEFDWVRVEPLGNLGDGVEFLLRRRDGGEEVHQVKRQRGSENEWSAPALKRLRIWETAQRHISSGRDYHFVSTVPFRLLQELADRARNSNDYGSFVRGGLSEALNNLFAELTVIYGDPVELWETLRRIYVRIFDEMELKRSNVALAGAFLEGSSASAASASLSDIVANNIDAELTSGRILEALRPYDLRRRLGSSQRGLAERIQAESSAWMLRVEQQLIQPQIPRDEALALRQIPNESEKVTFLLGAAGGGKTAVLHEVVQGLLQDNVPTLVLRLDRYGPLMSTVDLGCQLNLDMSPVSALAAAANGVPAVLIIDQLDAVSLASGRLPENFDVVADIVAEAGAIPTLRVLFGCRQFDVDNDHRLRTMRSRLKSKDVLVAPLNDEQVHGAVNALGLSATTLSPRQRDVLRVPLHLSLLGNVADRPQALEFTSSQWLFDAYWDHKRQTVRQRRHNTRFWPVVSRLADVMSSQQRLQVPVDVLDGDDLRDDADVLISEQLLVRDGRSVGFFHEALFDYAFARQWVIRDQSLIHFLTEGEQELFRRAQVRQILTHLRASNATRFLEETRYLFDSENIRFHIKDVALAVMGALGDPTSDEADLLLDVAEAHVEFQDQLWTRLQNPAWFQRLDVDGHITVWLNGDEVMQTRALKFIAGAAGVFPERMAEILAANREQMVFPEWLRWVLRFANIASSRPLFELLLDGVKEGVYRGVESELWLAAHNLADAQPDWAVDLLAAFLNNYSDNLTRDTVGWVKALNNREHGATELAQQAAEHAPRRFLDALLPYLLQVMAATASEDKELPRRDSALSPRLPGEIGTGNLGDVLFAGAASAIRSLVEADPQGMRPTLQLLAEDPHDNAQYLLYQGLRAGPLAYADWAAELLLQGPHRFLCGIGSNAVWVARQVLQAISPLISDELFGLLEADVRDLRFSWETRGRPVAGFTLLTALDERRLSDVGRRRLGELRRAMGREEPAEPEGIIGGWIGSPIASVDASRMTDGNWLAAMMRHAGENRDFRTLTGGARELSQVLKAEVAADPVRFAQVALRLSADLNPAYGAALLMGFGDAKPVGAPGSIFEAVWHIASLAQADHDRWLGYSLRRYFEIVPANLVELIRDRALDAAQPADDRRSVTRLSDDRQTGEELRDNGINTARGSLAEALGDLMIYDTDGSRTAIVSPVLNRLANDPSVAVRSCVAHTIAAAVRYARPEALEAFDRLVDTDDQLLAAHQVVRLVMYLGNSDPAIVRPTIERMLASPETQVRKAGGRLAAVSAMKWDIEDLLQSVLAGHDTPAREGVGSMAAHCLPHTENAAVASVALLALIEDPSELVRTATAEVARVLRNQALRPFEGVLKALIESPAFESALPHLLTTLEHAPDRVDDLALVCAQRFVEVLGGETGDISRFAAGSARQVGKLIIRGLAQAKLPDARSDLLDVLDGLLSCGAYGIEKLIGESERPN